MSIPQSSDATRNPREHLFEPSSLSYARARALALKRLIVILVALLLVFPVLPAHSATPASTQLPVNLQLSPEQFSSANITDPFLQNGFVFNMSIQATNLATVFGQSSSGISGFDIALSYNASVLRIAHVWSGGPDCPKTDNCIFDLPANDTFTVNRSIDSPLGLSRIGMLVLGPSHLPDLSNLRGLPAVLFRAELVVVGTGKTSISILDTSSQITGLDSGCGYVIPFTSSNAIFDNRSPFAISASPSSASVRPGNGVTIAVTVSRVNDLGYGSVTLELSNAISGITYIFTPRTSDLNSTHSNLSSTLVINTQATTPVGVYPLVIIGVLGPYPQVNVNLPFTVSSTAAVTQTAALPRATSTTVQSASNAPPPSSLFASFTPDSSPSLNNPIRFTAVAVWCSASPNNLQWRFGDGSVGTGNPVSHTYTASGAFTVTLNVTDNTGTSYSSSQLFNIPSPSQASTLYLYVLPSAVILIFFAAAGLLFVRRRRSPRRNP